MTPDLSYTTIGREGESSARIINRTEKKTDTKLRTGFETSYTSKQLITAVQWGYSDSRSLCDNPKQALIALICCVGNIWLLVRRGMAI